MSRLARLAVALLILLVGGYGVLFCLANPADTELDLVFTQLRPAPVSVWVLSAFVLGGICGVVSASVGLWRLRLRIRALDKKLLARDAAAGVPGARA